MQKMENINLITNAKLIFHLLFGDCSGSHQGTKTQRIDMNLTPLSEKGERIASKTVDAAYTVHKTIGPGLLEKVYEVCFCHCTL